MAADEHWDVWTDWYEDRLTGRTANLAFEIERTTISKETWERGPRIVNAHIKRLIKDPAIFADATATSLHDLERRLAALSLEEVAAIGARAGLRVLPLFTFGSLAEPTFAADFLLMLRAVSAAWTASRYPARARNRALSETANAEAMKARASIVRAVATSLTASGVENMSPGAAKFVAGGIDALRTAAFTHSDGDAAGAAFDFASSKDLRDLHSTLGAATVLAGIELWPGGAAPEWLARRWDIMKRDLIGADIGWEVWVNWYEDRVAGRTRSDAHEFAYSDVPGELWADGPAKVNTWIMRRFDWLEDQARGDPSTPQAPPAIPPQEPAAIEPVWSKGRLTLPKAPAKSDLKGRKFSAALKSLREELSAFAKEIAGEANIDRRFVSHVQKLALQIPQKAPRQAELFRLGHAADVFGGYSKTVDDEWPQILAARYHAIVLHFDRAMRQSRLWREFKRNAAQQTLTTQQFGSAASLAVTTARALRHEEVAALVDPTVPQALEHLAGPLQATGEPSENVIEVGKEELAFDLVESVNNILKRIAENALLQSRSPTRLRGA